MLGLHLGENVTKQDFQTESQKFKVYVPTVYDDLKNRILFCRTALFYVHFPSCYNFNLFKKTLKNNCAKIDPRVFVIHIC